MKKRRRQESDGSGRYIVTYADLLTLLCAFFIILFSMSEINDEKAEQLGGFLETEFHPRVEQNDIINISDKSGSRTYGENASEEEQKMMKSVSEQNNLRQVKKDIDEKVEENNLEESIDTTLGDRGLQFILTNEILFQSGSDTLNNEHSIDILHYIGNLVSGFTNEITIEGHTDDVPIHNDEFNSNWELSSARSLSVLGEILENNHNLSPGRFSAAGFGQYSPISTNQTAKGRKDNRRVEIFIEREYGDNLLKSEGGEKTIE